MVTLDGEVKPIADIRSPALVDGLNERARAEFGVSTIRIKKQRRNGVFCSG